MKKIVILLSLIFSMHASAQNLIQTPFWQTSVLKKIEFQLKTTQEGLAADCKDYADYAFSQGDGILAFNLELYRDLPLRKQMKDTYEAIFELISVPSVENRMMDSSLNLTSLLFFDITNAIVSIDFSTLKNIKGSYERGSLTELSKKFNLKDTPIELIRSPNGLRAGIKIKGRDVACDLLSGKYVLSAEAEYQVALPEESILKMDRFYKQIEDTYFNIVSQQENDFVKAALLGYAYGRLYQDQNVSAYDIKLNITSLFKNIFKTNSLDLNENWIVNGDTKKIDYKKSVSAGYGVVGLRY